MTGSARETVLARVRAAIDGDRPPAPVPREYVRQGAHGAGSDHAVEQLVDRLVDYRAGVRQVPAAGLRTAIADALGDARSVVVAADLDADLRAACGADGREVRVDGDPAPLTAHELDAVDAVVTTARVAVSLSGTIILDAGPGQGRRAISLVPDRHVVVLRRDQVVETVAEALAPLDPTRPLTMIAGPSATSDIELERVEGVHGPRTLEVVIVEADPQT